MAMLNNQRVIYIYTSGKLTVSELEHGPVEIVDLPSYKMVIFHSCLYVYQRVYIYIHYMTILIFYHWLYIMIITTIVIYIYITVP